MRGDRPTPRVWRRHSEIALRAIAVQAIRTAYPDVLQKDIATALGLTRAQVQRYVRGDIACADDYVLSGFKTTLTDACAALAAGDIESAAFGLEITAQKLRTGKAVRGLDGTPTPSHHHGQ